MRKQKYQVFDLEDYTDVLGYADSLMEVTELARKRSRETDGDCAIYYCELNEDTDQYEFRKRVLVCIDQDS
ncbi:hypothetical protein ACFQ4L_02710 [Lapidilactobacillus mulanensis]|uniref:Uncharacterized protein n=1 Tax=Lapidilactobacillus mulanensis TaxID=2485999 RepID=A0ABW4DK15_9LACO|nr:hypothetical protein [Lapidilactobacillus mulanensis]